MPDELRRLFVNPLAPTVSHLAAVANLRRLHRRLRQRALRAAVPLTRNGIDLETALAAIGTSGSVVSCATPLLKAFDIPDCVLPPGSARADAGHRGIQVIAVPDGSTAIAFDLGDVNGAGGHCVSSGHATGCVLNRMAALASMGQRGQFTGIVSRIGIVP